MKDRKLYNVFFPIWMIWLFPPIIILVLIINWLVDYLVVKVSLKDKANFGSTFKSWIVGFVSDIVGAGLLIATIFIEAWLDNEAIYDIINAVATNPFANPISAVIAILAVFISGLLIYVLNKKFVYAKSGLSPEEIKKVSRNLAIFTSPYFFLIPSLWLYQII